MDENKQLTPEELAAEQEALKEVKEDEVRAKVIEEFDFDETDDADRIDKLVAKQMEANKALSHAIGQKISQRKAKEEALAALKSGEKENGIPPTSEEIEKSIDARLEERDLQGMDLPDDIKDEVRKISKSLNLTVKKALRDPYIVFKVEEFNKTREDEDATINRTHKIGGKTAFSFDKMPDVDINTPEGLKAHEEWKTAMKKQGY